MKILKKEVVQKSDFLEFVKTNYMNTRNRLSTWFWCRRPKSRKAVVIACMVDDKLVVIKEFRIPVENYEIGFPAGLIDSGETPEDAVRRELEEETGLKVEEILHISPAVLSSAGLTDEAVHLAFVKASGTPNKDKLEASEDIDTSLLTRDEVEALMKDSEYPFGKTAYSVMRAFVKYGEIW
jgi:ADP-ribose pyrophosphatase